MLNRLSINKQEMSSLMNKGDGGVLFYPTTILPLVYFGNIEHDIRKCVSQSLDDLFGTLCIDLPNQPEIHELLLPDPGVPRGKNSEDCYITALHQITKSISIGITQYGLWHEFPIPRFIFAVGGKNSSILSLYRFLNDSTSRKRALSHITKEIPKVLALALSLPPCLHQDCYLSYHWQMRDFDMNTGLCKECKGRLTQVLCQTFSGDQV